MRDGVFSFSVFLLCYCVYVLQVGVRRKKRQL